MAIAQSQWIGPPSGGADDDGFGRAVALSGNILLVGSPGRSVWGYRSGDVQAFFRYQDQWIPIGDVLPQSLDAWDEFGSDIVLDGERGAIACPGRERVYLVFNAQGATVVVGEIEPPAGFEGSRFGTSVDMQGDLLVIGAQLDDTVALDAGAAHVYRYTNGTWNHEAHLTPTNGTEFSWAGRSVAVHGNRVAFGANLEPEGDAMAAGAVYVYRSDAPGEWALEARLVHPDPFDGDYLGYDVAMDGQRLIAGAILADGPNAEEDIGEVVVWPLTASEIEAPHTVHPPDLIGGEFGYAVAIEGDHMLVGAIFNPTAGPVAGAAYRMIHTDDGWTHGGTLLPAGPQDGAQMGFSVALLGNDAIVGCPRMDTSPRTGRVLSAPFIDPCPGDADASGTIDVDDILAVVSAWGPCFGCAADVTHDGDVGADDVLLVLAGWGPCDQP